MNKKYGKIIFSNDELLNDKKELCVTNSSKNTKKSAILLLQLMIIKNADTLGWTISNFDDKKIILTKKICNLNIFDNNLHNFMKNVIL
jgi:hypothetical protein